jgi:hypothetical protein
MNESVFTPLILTLVAAVAIWGLVSGLGHRPGVLFASGLASAAAALGLAHIARGPGGTDPVMGTAALLVGYLSLIGVTSGTVARLENGRDKGASPQLRLGGAAVIGGVIAIIAMLAI